ncbi:hypothetical protein KDA_13820 [Dictyobacter alpinus]|uniref:Uncharacterized protein n=1 Tax=Dictyobacter alpinus TaxID=2014873 RepID=A0A402B3I4_9CHLR|nr:hypothetical protein KDA_13820 [Dictyobacter alpinus]
MFDPFYIAFIWCDHTRPLTGTCLKLYGGLKKGAAAPFFNPPYNLKAGCRDGGIKAGCRDGGIKAGCRGGGIKAGCRDGNMKGGVQGRQPMTEREVSSQLFPPLSFPPEGEGWGN